MGADYDDDIAQGMTYKRWFQLKRVKKICSNNITTKKRQDGYNKNYKFDYIWICLFQNVKFITKHTGLDICGDEKSWETASYGEVGAGLIGIVFNKTGSMKGDQSVLVSDVHHIRYCAYRHIHKLHVNHPGCNLWGNIELKVIM